MDINLLRLDRQAAQLHVFYHSLSQGCHRYTSSNW
jgi:hypothetical protein